MIDEKKQIDDMADVIFEKSPIPSVWRSDAVKFAEALYSEGYHKQKEGEWIRQGDGTYYCSNCGHDATYTYDGTEIRGVACPFCGAWMKGEKDNG